MVAMLEESLSNHDHRGRHGCQASIHARKSQIAELMGILIRADDADGFSRSERSIRLTGRLEAELK